MVWSRFWDRWVLRLGLMPRDPERRVRRLRSMLVGDNRSAVLPVFGQALVEWGAGLTDAGEGQALEVCAEAVEVAEELLQAGDADGSLLLTRALTCRANCHLRHRSFADAIGDADRSALVLRQLASTGDGKAVSGLALALTVLSSAHREAGDPARALEFAAESSEHVRRYGQDKPASRSEWLLAACLVNEANARIDTLDRERAIELLEKARTLYGRMPSDRHGMMRSCLVTCLGNLATACSLAGRIDDALRHGSDAFALARTLPAGSPSFDRIRAYATRQLAARQLGVGDVASALATARQGCQEVAAMALEYPHMLIDEVEALNTLGVCLYAAGQIAESVKTAEAALQRFERASAALQADLRPNQARLLSNLALRLADAGRHAEALSLSEQALELGRSLYAADPRSHGFALVVYMNNTAIARLRADREAEALSLMEDAQALGGQLYASDPEALLALHAQALGTLGLACSATGRHDDALRHQRACVSAKRELVARHRAAYLRELAGSISNLGIAESQLGNLQQALEAALESLALYRELQTTEAGIDGLVIAGSLQNLAKRYFDLGQPVPYRAAARECGAMLLANPPSDPLDWTKMALAVSSGLNEVEDLLAWHQPLMRSLAEFRELAHDDAHAMAFNGLQAEAATYMWDLMSSLGAEHSAAVEQAAAALVSGLHSPDLARWLRARGGGAGLNELARCKQAVLEADQALQVQLRVGAQDGLPATPAPGAQNAPALQRLRERVLRARADFRVCRQRLVDADPQLHDAFATPGIADLRRLAGHGGAAGALFLLQVGTEDEASAPAAVGVYVGTGDGAVQLLEFPGLHALCLKLAHRRPGALAANRLRDAEADGAVGAADPVGLAPRVPLDELQRRLDTCFWSRLPERGRLHLCTHGDLQHLAPGLSAAGAMALQWPGLPFLSLSARTAPALGGFPGPWLVQHDCAWTTEQPLPMAALEADLARRLLTAHGRSAADTEVASPGPWAGLIACCHGRRRDAHFESALQFAQEPLEVRSLMGRRIVEHLALLPACHAGETREDAAGNGLGIAAAFLLGGTRVVVASSKAVPDDLMPWFTTLVLWHTLQGLPAHEAATLARAQFAALDFPPAFRGWLQAALPPALAMLQPGGAEHRGDARSLALLDDIADAWPWAGETLNLFSSDAARRAEATRSVAAGVLVPRGDETRRLRLQAEARETAAFVMVYGVA